MNNKKIHMVAFILLVIGGLNWLLVGLFNYDLVYEVVGGMLNIPILARIIFILVGLAAVYELATHKRNCRHCQSGPSMGSANRSSAPPTQP